MQAFEQDALLIGQQQLNNQQSQPQIPSRQPQKREVYYYGRGRSGPNPHVIYNNQYSYRK